MKRRHAIRNITLSLGGVLTLPAWAYLWNKYNLPDTSQNLSPANEELLADIAETFIPATDTPGAKEIGVHEFVLAMIYDCYDDELQKEFETGLKEINDQSHRMFKKSFPECSLSQRAEVLEKIEKENKTSPDEKFPAYPFIKELVIQGYLNSQYVMTHVTKYELIPGRFNGSFPINSTISTN